MINTPAQLLTRLDEIGQSLAQTGDALALLGLGSVGQELDRLDAFSDLDFFAIVKAGRKKRFIDNLDWLSNIQPIAYAFPNTADGCKLMFADGIFCEYAVFELAELATAVYVNPRLVWYSSDFDPADLPPVLHPAPAQHDVEWLIGEAITNLYVGLGRYQRGEKVSAFRFIQTYAVERLLDLTTHIMPAQPAHPDMFGRDRRYEQHFPDAATHLPHFMQGYDKSCESAQAILDFLDTHFAINPAMKRAIETLINQ